MMKTKRMSKIQVIGPKKYLKEVIAKLHKLEVMHIVDHKKTEDLDIGNPLDVTERISEVIVRVRALISQFKIKGKPNSREFTLNQIEKRVNEISDMGRESIKTVKEVDTVIAETNNLLEQLEILNKFDFNIEDYRPYTNISCYLGYIKEKDIEEKLNKITKNYKLQLAEHDEKPIIALFIQNKYTDKAEAVLKDFNYTHISVDEILDLEGSPAEHINTINSSLEKFNKKKEKLQQYLDKLGQESRRFLLDAEYFLKKESEKAEAPLRFASTREAFLVTGFVPKKKFERVKKELEKVTKRKIDLQIKEIGHDEKVPTSFHNPKIAKSFEFFMELFSIPGYREIDPTIFLMITFPLFFGLMLGDVGYGLVCLLLFALLRWKLPYGKQLLNAMMWCAIITIMFGFVFGEFFGYEYITVENGYNVVHTFNLPLHIEELVVNGEPTGQYVYHFPRLINRAHQDVTILGNTLPLILVIGGLLGILHVNIGLFLGFINELSHSLKEAILAKVSWWILQAGVVLLALSGAGIINLSMWVGGILICIAAIMLVLGEGIQGIIELPSIFTNIISYFRLGAVGLASVGLAMVINNDLAGPFMEKGGIFVVVGVLIFILGHAVNIALGVIGPFLHSIRLHYVEFFTKFYKGGGMKYVPFGQKE